MWAGKPLDLPPKERAVLAILIQKSPKAVSKDEIIKHAWYEAADVSDDSLIRCISRLRREIPEAQIEAVYGYGYKLRPIESINHGKMMAVANGPSDVVELYLHALTLIQTRTPISAGRALELFRRITMEHPEYAPAKIALVQAIGICIGLGMAEELSVNIDEAWKRLDEANALEPNAHSLKITKAWLLDVTWKFDEAELLYNELLKAEPNDLELLQPYSWHLLATGRATESTDVLRKVLARRPYSIHTRVLLARSLAHAGNCEVALQEMGIAAALYPDNPIVSSVQLAMLAKCRPDPSLIKQAMTLYRIKDIPPYARVCLPYVLANCGKPDEARQEIEKTEKASNWTITEKLMVASAMVLLGELDRGAKIIVEAYEQHHGWLPVVLRSPLYAPLLNHADVKRVFNSVFGL